MPPPSKKLLRKLSWGFSKQIGNDVAKNVLRIPKMILEIQFLWPDRANLPMKMLNWLIFFNLSIMQCGHVFYLLYNISDVFIVTRSFTTISTSFQMGFKVFTLTYYKDNLNEILSIIWDDFWPVKMADENTKKGITRGILFVKTYCYIFVVLCYLCCSLFMCYPIMRGDMTLPLESKYPFSYDRVILYELFYIWQWFSNYSGAIIMAGHDTLFCCLLINCVVQFTIIQDVLKNMYASDDERLRNNIFSQLGITTEAIEGTKERLFFLKCFYHHLKVMEVCDKLEHVFSLIIFLQFFESTVALCVSSFVLIVTQTEYPTMVVYGAGHILQLFMYCTMGNELIYESKQVAVAAFECGWHSVSDKYVAYGVSMVIQRAQKQIQLTALGFVELSYRSFLMVLRLSFSFYTMLNNVKDERRN